MEDFSQIIREADAEAGGGRRSSEDHLIMRSIAPHLLPPLATSLVSQAEAKARIMAHPHYPNLIGAYVDCQKVGAPPDVADRLAALGHQLETQRCAGAGGFSTADPELDQFMEAYCDMLVKYREELSRPIEEAVEFLRKAESQLNSIADVRSELRVGVFGPSPPSDEDHLDASLGEAVLEGEPQPKDRELKHQLLMKYSGFLGSLRHELSKTKKKGKLPKEARQKLLSWWELHKKWPYPSESEKAALVESTGLDQKQINNWFINQRKRHWKPSEEMQFMVLDGYHHQQNASSFYMDGHLMGDGSLYRIGP